MIFLVIFVFIIVIQAGLYFLLLKPKMDKEQIKIKKMENDTKTT